MKATAEASPSLALVKYWGKREGEGNIPATSSLAVTLDGLHTRTTVECAGKEDRITLNGVPRAISPRSAALFARVREASGYAGRFIVRSRNDFATSAGLASSSSGFAALAAACLRAVGAEASDRECSAIARVGSASAARSVFGGFTALRAGAEAAEPLRDEGYWPDLAVLVCTVSEAEKSLSSGAAMELSKRTSPYYGAWLADSAPLFEDGLAALEARDLPRLGEIARRSYLRMHAVMMSSSPPLIYPEPASLRIIRLCEGLRARGVGAWETMDAGPQVKILCSASEAGTILDALGDELPTVPVTVSRAGRGVIVVQEEVS